MIMMSSESGHSPKSPFEITKCMRIDTSTLLENELIEEEL